MKVLLYNMQLKDFDKPVLEIKGADPKKIMKELNDLINEKYG